MESIGSLLGGFATALAPENLMYAFLGSVLGTLIGVLPGIGPAAGTAMLIPLTFHLPATGAIIMLAAIYYGTQYGGTITSVLINVPGEATTAVTCLDGYPMARNGRAGAALSIAAIGSFVGGTLATFGLVMAAPPLARFALRFGPPEQFALMTLGLSLIMALAGSSVIKALMMGLFGLLLAMVGMEPSQGVPRFTFDRPELLSGLAFVPVVMGLFGLGDIFVSAEKTMQQEVYGKLTSLIPTRKDAALCVQPILRGTAIGFFLGLIPGMLPSISSFMSYIAERKLSKYPERFGTGVIEGVAGPESANNAHANATLVPLFTLGIPTTPTIAVLMGAFMMNGLVPGPLLFKDHPDFVWAVIASLYVGNVMLLILNLPLVGLWVSILRVPYSILFALILIFTIIGSYSINNNMFDVGIMVFFGVLGYVFKKLYFPIAPAILTLVLGPLMEQTLRTSLLMSDGDFGILLRRPISAVLLGLATLFLLASSLRFLRLRADQVRNDGA